MAFSLGFVALYAGFAYANAYSTRRRDPQVIFVLGSIAQIVLVTVLMSPLTYVAAGADFPLRDAELLAADRALGLDWAAYVTFVNDHPLLSGWLSYGYAMIRWPLFAIPVILTAARRYCRLQDFTLGLRAGLDRDHDRVRPGTGDRRLSADRARSVTSRTSMRSPISIRCVTWRRCARACCAISICSGSPAS